MKILTRRLFLLLMILFFMLLQITVNGFNKSLEGKALVATNWWPQYVNVSDDYCNWYEIYCNEAGSVTDISFYNHNLEGYLGSLDFSSFPNLVSLRLEASQSRLVCSQILLSFHFGGINSQVTYSGGPRNFSMGVRNIFKNFRPLGI
ncbi:putative leucine-rich repeat domain superfamily [Helianthus annuus]|nr:putative leucine-rich repeat domain superfamily [Helianthus annuus]